MEITVCKNAGFCFGVKNAIDTAVSASLDGSRVFTYGEIIHNELVVDDLKDKGIGVVTSADEVEAGDKIVIRAHGLASEIVDKLTARGAVVLDATCPFVKRIHQIVSAAAAEGKQVVVVGEKGHPETEGIMSYAGGEAVLLETEAEAGELEIKKPTVVVSQTTFSREKFENVAKIIENNARACLNLVEIFNTICYTTHARQAEVEDLAAKYDAVVVVGSEKSSNTRRLFEIAKALNENTFYIRNTGDLTPLWNNIFCSILITAGASTPPWLIEEVISSMDEALNTTPETEVVSENTDAVKEQADVAETVAAKKTDEAEKVAEPKANKEKG